MGACCGQGSLAAGGAAVFLATVREKTEVFLGLKILGVFTAGCGIVCSCSVCEQYSPLSLTSF